MCTSEGVQGGGRSKPGLILLDFWQTGPVDPDFFGQEPSLDCKDSFEPKSSFLDQMVQKLRAYKGLYVFPFPGLIYRYLDKHTGLTQCPSPQAHKRKPMKNMITLLT